MKKYLVFGITLVWNFGGFSFDIESLYLIPSDQAQLDLDLERVPEAQAER